ncbi:MAG: hypothetical protein DWQ11_14940 [Proteobacteria bacterium]|nr:MAG: hypothetical protein DWQ11_14940 [Pseudomonadota bacterium]
MSGKKVRFTYPGKTIDVTWDSRLCIHVAECGRAAGELFVDGREPWCQPDLTEVAQVREIVERCPSGALSYADKTGGPVETPAVDNTVVVACNGPLFFRGNLHIEGRAETAPGVRFRAALCRCGASKNKPFCDNSHEAVGFKDYGAVGETGSPQVAGDGALRITPTHNGPLVCKGHLRIYTAAGRAAWFGTTVALCRCGASKNKPFCDGSHVTAGFRSD